MLARSILSPRALTHALSLLALATGCQCTSDSSASPLPLDSPLSSAPLASSSPPPLTPPAPTPAPSLLHIAPQPADPTPLVRSPWTFGKPPSPTSPTVVVRPREIHGHLDNPGIGVQTFQRYRGQTLNPGLTGHNWSEAGPTQPLPDAPTRPDYPDSTVAYLRWHWATIEPEKGHVRWDIIDTALGEARRHGQTLALRLMPYDHEHPLPTWYQNSGARRVDPADDPRSNTVWEPDVDDPRYLKHWGDLVTAAGARYDGHPDLDSVDIATHGPYGEGWSDALPSLQRERELVDLYFKAFTRTPLLINDQPRVVDYAVARGAGWRLDCWGDMRSSEPNVGWSHMLDSYPMLLSRPPMRNAWRRSPVSLETCSVTGDWIAAGWDIEYILDQALAWHASTINLKSSAIPSAWRARFDAFIRRLGYRLVLRRLEHPRKIKAGASMQLSLWWQNVGVAPVYRPYIVALQLRSQISAQAPVVLELPLDVRDLLPGDSVWEGALRLPRVLPHGPVTLRLALLDPRSREPAIRLAIEGRESDGWYNLGSLIVE
ncbi:DUF4832 domain-containing protein [Chondromyces crocatus]|uniref:DUF4832 domain-containing protein n=1 Tax=Chondromyces crocatus TaxID=52 RepID=A0A0K1EAH1_CHOCO|nr:DUF4832 domain-containing protein [Chondromyces crocatus]AKT37859.1 uncharacterized protein CMC5_020020 [Chondromyces crocatus]